MSESGEVREVEDLPVEAGPDWADDAVTSFNALAALDRELFARKLREAFQRGIAHGKLEALEMAIQVALAEARARHPVAP